MFWDILNRNQQQVLEKILNNMPLQHSYLAGGTSLALILGHRESIDFDWFIPKEFDSQELEKSLSLFGQVKTIETKKGTYHGFLDDVRISWLYYPNPLIEPLRKAEGTDNLFVPSLTDIGLMKITALSHRGARKDFIDLYTICMTGVSLDYLISMLPRKFPGSEINYYHLLKSLSYFDDAQREQMPVMRLQLTWGEVKNYFLEEQIRLMKDYAKGQS